MLNSKFLKISILSLISLGTLCLIYKYVIPNNSVKEILTINRSVKELSSISNSHKKLEDKKMEIKSIIKNIPLYKDNKNKNINIIEQENGTSVLNFNINEKTRVFTLYSGDYNYNFCNDILEWSNNESFRNSAIGKLGQVNHYNDMVHFRNIMKDHIKINNMSILDENVKCDKNSNDISYSVNY